MPDAALKLELPHIELATEFSCTSMTITIQRLASNSGGKLNYQSNLSGDTLNASQTTSKKSRERGRDRVISAIGLH